MLSFEISYQDLLKILGVIINTLFAIAVDKYSSFTPQKLNIKQKQFDLIYKPLYILLSNIDKNKLSKNLCVNYLEKIKTITSPNEELVNPTLKKLIEHFGGALFLNKHEEHFEKVCYNVEIEYLTLKRILKYPKDTPFNTFKYMNKFDRFIYILTALSFIVLLLPIFLNILMIFL